MNLLFTIGFLDIDWVDIMDITLVSILLYQLYKLARGTVALTIFIGFLVLYFIFLIVRATEMELLTAILDKFMGVGVLAAIVLFQQEIRKFLILLGKSADLNDSSFFGFFRKWRKNRFEEDFNPVPILDAMKFFSENQTGSLIVLSKNSDLMTYANTGDWIDAFISKRLLISIFDKHSPLHDGAVIIHKGRIKAARCILPVSENSNISASMGLRHRAGIGMSEVTDTLVLLVSEETGECSVARNGSVFANLTIHEVRTQINEYIYENIKDNTKTVPIKQHP